MKRLFLLLILATVATIFSVSAQTQEIVLVLSGQSADSKAMVAGFKSGMGGNFREINLDGSDVQQKKVGEELKAKKPAVTVVVGDLAAQMAKWYLGGLPIIYCDSIQAAKITLTSGNAVGIYYEPDFGEQLRMIKELFSNRKRIALIYSPEYSKINEADIRKKSQALGLTLEIVAMDSIKSVPDKLKGVMPKSDVLWVFSDPTVLNRQCSQYITLQSITAKVPIFCGDKILAHNGAAAAYIPDMEDAGKKAAAQAQLILRGARPTKASIIYPKGKLVLNQKIASACNLSFPPPLVNQAAEVIK